MGKVLSELLDEKVEAIKAKYEELGYSNGWRFLYCPKSTLSTSTRIMFVGINPGGLADKESEGFKLGSQKRGNAYRREVEEWGGNGRGLQREVCALFERLSQRLEGEFQDMNTLMDKKTLTSNLCPFRSKGWEEIEDEAVAFSLELWQNVLEHLHPSLIICMGGVTFDSFWDTLLPNLGFDKKSFYKIPTGWGQVCFRIAEVEKGNEKVMIVFIPHLSHYRLMTRKECETQTDELIQRMADWLNQTSQ